MCKLSETWIHSKPEDVSERTHDASSLLRHLTYSVSVCSLSVLRILLSILHPYLFFIFIFIFYLKILFPLILFLPLFRVIKAKTENENYEFGDNVEQHNFRKATINVKWRA